MSLICILLASSCSRTEQFPSGNEDVCTGLREFTATIETTKADFNGGKVSWSQDDEIAISDGIQTSLFRVARIESGVATFKLKDGEIELGSTASKYTAWYPSSLAGELKPVVIAEVGEETKQLPMGAVSQNARLDFRNICSLIKFSVSSNSEGVGLQSIRLTADKALSGPFSIVNGAAVMSGEAASSMSISSNDSGGFPLASSPTVLYLAVPEGDYSVFTIEATASNGVKKVFPLMSENLSLKRNTIYTKSLVLNDLDVNDFREEGPANCYIATHKGKYRFAAVRGDGSAIGNIADVKVLWLYNNTQAGPDEGTIVSSISYSDGVVDFTTDELEGSALLGAVDASDNILWSWHIWRTNSVPADITYSNAIMMDRYLGALSNDPGNIKCVGMMYQYGRKDPFPGRVVAGNTLGSFVGLSYQEKEGPVDLETATRNPNIRYYGTDSNFWTTAEARSEADWDGENKTVQDPCPYGYRVPSTGIFGTTAKADIQKLFTWDAPSAGFVYGSDAAWYPTTGQLAPKGKNLNSGTLISFSWSRNYNANGNPLFLDLRNSAINGWSGGAAAAGFAVRCERI